MAIREPVCNHCGYPTQGLPSLTCPECGSDLRVVGIRTPRMGLRPSSRFAAAIGWTMLIGALAIGTVNLTSQLFRDYEFSFTQEFSYVGTRSGNGRSLYVAFSANGHGFRPHTTPNNFTLTLIPDGSGAKVIQWTGHDDTFTYTTVDGVIKQGALNRKFIEGFLLNAGLNYSSADLESLSDDLVAACRVSLSGHPNRISFQKFKSGSGSSHSSSTENELIFNAGVFFFVVVWVVVMVKLYWTGHVFSNPKLDVDVT